MKDILLGSNRDLLVVNGDFVIGDSDEQQQNMLLITKKGELKQNPDVGVGLSSFLKDDDTGSLITEVNRQFTKDGMIVRAVKYVKEILSIDASYR